MRKRDPISDDLKQVAIALFAVRLDVKTEEDMAVFNKAVTAIGDAFWPNDETVRLRWSRMCLSTVEIQQ